MNGEIPKKDALLLDAGCGPGSSTEILARFADPSWTILAYDLSHPLIELTKRKRYRNDRGQAIQAFFLLSRSNLLSPIRELWSESLHCLSIT